MKLKAADAGYIPPARCEIVVDTDLKESAWKQYQAQRCAWKAHPKQEIALLCPANELLFGGAAGGGKSDYLLADALWRAVKYGKGFRGILFRRSYPELEELITRALELYAGLAVYKEQKKVFIFKGGGYLKLRFLEKDRQVTKYQGHQYCWIGWDELGQWATDYCYRYMLSRLRSAAGVPCVVRASANPGGAGNAWLKNRFIDSWDPLEIHVDPETKHTLVFVQSFLVDNFTLCRNDPTYAQRLDALPEAERRALKFGDWDVFSGQVFAEFRRDKHLCKPFALGEGWTKFCSFDWGYAKPYSIGWWAVNADGRMVRYREMYGCTMKTPNVGLKQGAAEIAKRAWEASVGEGVTTMIADPAIWGKDDNVTSIAESFEKAGWTMIRADNSRLPGLAKIHELMQTEDEHGHPYMIAFNTCVHWARTIPALCYDPNKPEDVDTEMEDHAYDDTRYAAMSKLAKNPYLVTPAPSLYGRRGPTAGEYDSLNMGIGLH